MDVPHFRPGTDDDRWVIPELIHQDMYRVAALAQALDGIDGTILDCGAHIGVFASLLAAHGVRQPIETFEPEPSNYALLVKNVASYPTITPRRLAVGRQDEERTLYDCGETGRWSFVPPGSGGTRRGVPVQVIDLYRHVRELGEVALLKLDLEGYEAELLNHMPADVFARITLLLTEEHHLPIDHARLAQAGFELWFHPRQDPRQRVYRAVRSRSKATSPKQPTGAVNPQTKRSLNGQAQPPDRSDGSLTDLLPAGVTRTLDLARMLAPRHPKPGHLAGNVDTDSFDPGPERFEAVVCGQLLEVVRDPTGLLRRIRDWLRPGGCVLAQVDNVRHHAWLSGLLEGHWGLAGTGYDQNKRIRFFTRREIEKLFFRAGYTVEVLRGLLGSATTPLANQGSAGLVNLGNLQVRGLSHGEREEFFASTYQLRASLTPEPDFGLTSIVLLTHNELAYTRQCLDSIRCHTDEPYEVIVVDNASTDGTPEYLQALGGVTLVRNAVNRGFPAGANQGLQAARGRQVLLLNNDTVVTTGWLRRMLRTLHSDPRIGLVGPCSNQVSGEQQINVDYDTDLVGLDGFAWEWGKAHDGRREETDRLVGFCLLIRREVLDKVGLLDEQFGVGCFEDDDYCQRVLQAGYQAVIARAAFVHHYGGRTFVGTGVDFAALMRRNQALYQKKWTNNAANPPSGDSPEEACHLPDLFTLRKAPGGGLLLVRRSVRLSLCMIVRDNARTLEACLTSIRPWVDEMCVVDTGSVDETPQLAARLGARVFHFPWCDSFSAARNESLRHARGQWVFWMDSDDTISLENGRKLRTLTEQDPGAAILGYIMQVHCPGPGPDGDLDMTVVDHVKLFRNLPHLRFEGRIHEQILPAIRRSGGETAWTDVFVVHSGYDHTPEGQERKKQRDLKLLHLELEEQPEHPFTLFNLGMTYADIGEPALAIDFLTRSISRSGAGESHLRKAYALLVYCHALRQQGKQAREACERGLQLFPEDAELRFRRAILLHEAGYLREAAAAYHEILDKRLERYFTSVDRGIFGFKARQNLALVYVDQEDFARAEEQWRLVVQEAPRHRQGWRGLGEVLLRRGKLDEAAALVERLSANQGLRADGLLLRGQLAAAQGRFQEAEAYYRQAVVTSPGDSEPLDVLCRFLFEQDQPAAAEMALRDLLHLRPEDAAAYHNLGAACAQQGRVGEAAAAFRRSVQLRPDAVRTWLCLGNALRNEGQWAEAVRAWEQAARLDPTNAEAREALRQVRQTATS